MRKELRPAAAQMEKTEEPSEEEEEEPAFNRHLLIRLDFVFLDKFRRDFSEVHLELVYF